MCLKVFKIDMFFFNSFERASPILHEGTREVKNFFFQKTLRQSCNMLDIYCTIIPLLAEYCKGMMYQLYL